VAGVHRAPAGPSWSEHFQAILAERDHRYEQRYEASQVAIQAALAADRSAVQAALTAQEKNTQAALVAAKEAVLKAETAAERRFEAVNEFRGQLADQAATFMPRAEAEQRLRSLAEKLDDLKGSSRAGASSLYGYLVAAAGVIFAVVSIVLK
jgi:hypothetical protein